ncbi:DNA replication initiation control protein YabA [Vagococcus salmoninarum]|uniref:Replication initiation control protein YabA n=1 Tax=Vagococcus salmoninarum TaxID=2739 RepID=A0A429ZT58_9ENTE|nr:DNA replication initiation control protein YabA [Vagococcus salmoninarum]MBE9388617.1 DNA replication initiation control protein YabA [Vagococcus salmoninarum]RST96844.1 DNA replication initiation control protein YabA [Vagococcus salmoninarum]
MDKRTLHDEFGHLETEVKNILTRLSDMKEAVDKLTEQNVSLEIENRHLRARLMELEAIQNSSDEKQELSKSRLNLEKIYEEGFHVCNVCYGSRRENDEECAFCLDVIYGERK